MKNIDEKNSNLVHTYIENFQHTSHCSVLYLSVNNSKEYSQYDINIKGIFVPSKQSVLLKKDITNYTVAKNNIRFSLVSIYVFLKEVFKNDINSINLIFSMFDENLKIYENEKFTSMLKENYKYIITKDIDGTILQDEVDETLIDLLILRIIDEFSL